MTGDEAVERARAWLTCVGEAVGAVHRAEFRQTTVWTRFFGHFCDYGWLHWRRRVREGPVTETYRLLDQWVVTFRRPGVDEPSGPQDLIRVAVDDATGSVRHEP